MHWIRGKSKKLNKKPGQRMATIIGTFCLVIATVLTIFMLSLGDMESEAAGYASVDNGNDQSSFWYGFTIPNNMKIWQSFDVITKVDSQESSKTQSYNKTYNSNYYNTSLEVEYAVEDEFAIKVQNHVMNADSSAFGTDLRSITSDTWYDSSGTLCKMDWISSYASDYKYTYYRVVEQGNAATTNWGDKLFSHYLSNYNPGSGYSYGIVRKKSEYAMVTNRDSNSSMYKLVDDYLVGENGFTRFSSDASIPMTKNGKPIAGIEMITIDSRDLYYDVYRPHDSTSSKRVDLDVCVYTSHNYQFTYKSSPEALAAPEVSTESGYSVVNGISQDDSIILDDGYEDGIAKPQYYLSNSKITNTSAIAWKDYQEPFSPEKSTYLYVRNAYVDGMKNYTTGAATEHKIKYIGNSNAYVTATPENGETIDVGKEITLSAKEAATGASIFYVVNKTEEPRFTKVTYSKRQELSLDIYAGEEKYVKLGDTVYIKVNGLWYESSDNSLVLFNDPIVTDESLRTTNTITIFAFIEDSGKEIGGFHSVQYSYNSSEQTLAPESTVATSTSAPTTVKMGDSIGLVAKTQGSRIFYTVDGSAPLILVDENGPYAGADNTKEYNDSVPIVVTEDVANYGKSFMIMAQAVTYLEEGGRYYKISQDSPVAKFIYKVAEQTPVDAVASIPQTNTETPTEVQIGSKIQLYSPTDGVDIYYTLDGSEPALIPENKYNGAQGILVPEPDNSSLFTITAVAYKEGLAVSDISRLVFAYPGAVSSPYANPISGAVTENTEVVLKSATEDAVIYYEIAYGDKVAAEPTTASEVFDASNPIVISQKANIKAIAVKNSITSSVSSFTYTVSDKLAIPTPSIDTGSVVTSGTVISLKADEGATIYYTLDGTNPKDSANKAVQVGSQVVINAEAGELIMLRTYAAKTGFTDSDAGTYSYSISAYAAGIYADREDGATVKNGDEIYLHTDMSDADIYYTLDGSAPTTDSHKGSTITVYGEPGEQFTIMAMAVADGSEKSNAFATFTYIIMNKLAAPTASVPDNAIFTKESIVELTAESERIYYTTDGSDPTTASNLYKKSIIIDGPVTIKAIAVADDLETSDISTFTYGFADKVAAPIASYASGELEMGTKVAFTSATEGAAIYYRTDGKDINLSRKNELEIYKEPITINQATNFKVIAVKDKMQDSNVLKVGYTVKEPVVIEAVTEEEAQNLGNQGNRLQSRRSFSDTESGPSYKDVVLRNASYGAIVAAEEGVLPDQVQLRVESTNVTDAVDRRVKQVISDSFGVVASYDVTLLVNGEEAQPEGTIEIGLPIPVEYENAMIYIVHVQEDGNIELFETRRSGGVAYAKIDHLSVFSITAPVEFDEEVSTFPWLPVMYTLAVGLTGIGIWLIYKSKKQRREDGMQDV